MFIEVQQFCFLFVILTKFLHIIKSKNTTNNSKNTQLHNRHYIPAIGLWKTFRYRYAHIHNKYEVIATDHISVTERSPLCIQSSTGSCPSGWTIASSRFSLGLLAGRGRGGRKSHKGCSDRLAVYHQKREHMARIANSLPKKNIQWTFKTRYTDIV